MVTFVCNIYKYISVQCVLTVRHVLSIKCVYLYLCGFLFFVVVVLLLFGGGGHGGGGGQQIVVYSHY